MTQIVICPFVMVILLATSIYLNGHDVEHLNIASPRGHSVSRGVPVCRLVVS